MCRKKGFGSFLHYVNASVEVLLYRNQYTITGFICHYYVGNIFKASFLEKMKKIRSKLQVLAARNNKLLQFSDFSSLDVVAFIDFQPTL